MTCVCVCLYKFAPRLAKLYSFAAINHLRSHLFNYIISGISPPCCCVFTEKLLTSEGRELRRALFSLKQIFQEDKDLVHGFVGLGGLNCLVQIGNEADQNYQNYILRALGQVRFIFDRASQLCWRPAAADTLLLFIHSEHFPTP
jgi:hypothetical protein